jgi:hypothetical protein
MQAEDVLGLDDADIKRWLGATELALYEYPPDDTCPRRTFAGVIRYANGGIGTPEHDTREAALLDLAGQIARALKQRARRDATLADLLRQIPRTEVRPIGRGHPRKAPRVAGPRNCGGNAQDGAARGGRRGRSGWCGTSRGGPA